MFAPQTPMRLIGCNGKQLKEAKSERRRALVLSFQLQPFTPDHANDLNIKSRLFSTSDGEPLKDVISTTLAISAPPQHVRIFLATGNDAPISVELYAALVQPKLTVRKDREGPIFSATLHIVSDYPSGDNLLLLMQRVTEQFFVTLETEQGDMLGDASDQQPNLVGDDDNDDND